MFRRRLLALALLALPAVACASGRRNVVLFIGDGMGFRAVELASLWATGRPDAAPFADWPLRMAMSTPPAGAPAYDPASSWQDFDAVRHKVTDSAAAATALASGVKTSNGVLGLDPAGARLELLPEWLDRRGVVSGVVTSVQFAHATPAGFAAHVEKRSRYEEIARQMLLDSPLRVIAGCGHPGYGPSGEALETPRTFKYVGGEALWAGLLAGDTAFDLDGDGAADRWLPDLDGDGVPDPWRFPQTTPEIATAIAHETNARLLIVPRVADTLQEERAGERHTDPGAVPLTPDLPTLAGMAIAALEVLEPHDGGFFLMVEGGAIDWAAHENDAGRLVEEQLAFEQAVRAVELWLDRRGVTEETLLIVTADHETGYLSAPGESAEERWRPLESRGAGALPPLRWNSDDHQRTLVPFFATGPGAETLREKARGVDPRRGPYLDNTDLAPALRALWASPR